MKGRQVSILALAPCGSRVTLKLSLAKSKFTGKLKDQPAALCISTFPRILAPSFRHLPLTNYFPQVVYPGAQLLKPFLALAIVLVSGLTFNHFSKRARLKAESGETVIIKFGRHEGLKASADRSDTMVSPTI